jgi:hypothetical protein
MVLILFSFLRKNAAPNEQPLVTPAPVEVIATPPSIRVSSNQVSSPSAQEAVTVNEDAKKGELINILPYSGAYFSFDFDFVKNTFVLTLDKSNIVAGNNNFDVFLKNNGIQNQSWFKDLQIIYQ